MSYIYITAHHEQHSIKDNQGSIYVPGITFHCWVISKFLVDRVNMGFVQI